MPGLLIADVLFFALGWNIRADLARHMATVIPAQGTVVEDVSRIANTNSGKRTFDYPVVKFRTATGEPIRFESPLGSNPPAFQAGEQGEVLYNPQTPQSTLVNP